MIRDQLKAVLDRVMTWPPERQQDVVDLVREIEEQDHSRHRLSDEQVAEVRRRLAEPRPDTVPSDDVFRRLRARER